MRRKVKKKLTTSHVEIYLMYYFNIRRNLIVPNVSWGLFNHECDLLVLRKSNWATEIEIKISKQDLLADKKKKHKHYSNKIRYLYFAVPDYLVEFALNYIPDRAGLFSVSSRSVKEVKKPVINKNAVRFSIKDRLQLSRLGTMRIYGLKRKLLND